MAIENPYEAPKARLTESIAQANASETDDFEYVGFWPRVGASIIDTIILLIITVPLLVSIYGWEYFTDLDTPLIAGPADFLLSWVLPGIAVILFWLYKQATPGKMVVSARVVDARTGNTLTVGQSIGRYLAYFIAMLPLFLGIIWVAFDPRKQGWHDKLAGTVVIRPKHHSQNPVRFEP
ncbi:MAG: RDD family protein [Azoarcus sp.]|jgi:uncharacterized RDD family membrane protein YckC|nr:RDD family protein [Azoarcus sp.]